MALDTVRQSGSLIFAHSFRNNTLPRQRRWVKDAAAPISNGASYYGARCSYTVIVPVRRFILLAAGQAPPTLKRDGRINNGPDAATPTLA